MNAVFKNYIYPIATLAGSIIGVGFLSLPYITLRVGIWPMLFYFSALTGLVLLINLVFCDISLKTPDFKRFPGFIEFHLGKTAKTIALAAAIFGSWGVSLIYLFVGAGFLKIIASPFLGQSTLFYALAYFAVVTAVIYFGNKINAKLDFWALLLLLVVLAVVCLEGFGQIKAKNIFTPGTLNMGDWKTLFLPYGAILFSLWGTGLIPDVEEMLRDNKKILKTVVVMATLFVALLYLAFIFLILGITGGQTTDSALAGLGNFLPKNISFIAILIGIITTFMGFVSQGIFLKEIFVYDMRIKHSLAWVLTCFIPLGLFLTGLHSFIGLISFIGGVLVGINGIFILLMYKKIGGKKIIVYPLTGFFLLGIIYEVVYFFK